MSLKYSSETLRSLLTLTERHERLTAEAAAIDDQIAKVLAGGTSIGNGRRSTPPKAGKRGKRGALKARVLAGFKEAGEKGIAIKDLAAKLGVRGQNLHVWVHSTGKKNGLVETVGKGLYRLKQSPNEESHRDQPEAPKSEAAGAAVKKPGRKARKRK